ncbi:putative integral membrane protein [Acanthocheilonema viteae]
MFGRTLKGSFRQLSMMAVVVLTGVIFFSTLMYFIEKDLKGVNFIPYQLLAGGYGDLTPTTLLGKLVATGAITCGILILALPITIIEVPLEAFVQQKQLKLEGLVRREIPQHFCNAAFYKPLSGLDDPTSSQQIKANPLYKLKIKRTVHFVRSKMQRLKCSGRTACYS